MANRSGMAADYSQKTWLTGQTWELIIVGDKANRLTWELIIARDMANTFDVTGLTWELNTARDKANRSDM